jgi:nondiscriminating glutamyl-tRNA synthetase
MSVRVRFAPSPTGNPHLGGVRTAVFDYLFARNQGGTFIFRLEDTDKKREVEGSDLYLAESLKWLGIEADEGVYLDEHGALAQRGNYGPYIQSQRLDIYAAHIPQLLENGGAYRCFCTPERIEAMRAEQEKNHQPPRYDRTCRVISLEESNRRAASGESFVVRQAMPLEGSISFEDVIRGEISFECKDLDDQVLIKSDGFPTYQFANVVDDHLMEISHVIRGEEWTASTPKNLLLYKSFGWDPPLFAHAPVILGPDKKSKLSKRHGAEPVLAYRDFGYLPAALINFLAFLGWSPGTEEEFFTLDELAKRFRLEKVQKSPAVFDATRLDYVNGWYIRQMPVGEVLNNILPYFVQCGYLTQEGEKYFPKEELYGMEHIVDYLFAVAFAVQERIKRFDETAILTEFFFKRPIIDNDLRQLVVPKKETPENITCYLREITEILRTIEHDQWLRETIEERMRGYIARTEINTGALLWPVRAVLTGVAASPGAFEMLGILGQQESLYRLDSFLS